MPTTISSFSGRAHSCSLVYLRSSLVSVAALIVVLEKRGVKRESPASGGAGSLVERRLYDDRFDCLAAAVRGDRREHGRHVAEPDVLAERRRGRAGGADADARAVRIEQRIGVARDAAADHLEADEFARGPGGLDACDRFSADECRLVELDRP